MGFPGGTVHRGGAGRRQSPTTTIRLDRQCREEQVKAPIGHNWPYSMNR
jgi:hypothetical protein